MKKKKIFVVSLVLIPTMFLMTILASCGKTNLSNIISSPNNDNNESSISSGNCSLTNSSSREPIKEVMKLAIQYQMNKN